MTINNLPFQLNPETTALVVVDLQKGIVNIPVEPYSSSQVVQNAQKLLKLFRKNGSPVFLVNVSGSFDGKDRLNPRVDMPMVRRGSTQKDWSEFVPEIMPKENDLVITKRQWGAFYGTELDLELRRRGMKTIVLCGIATNIGVESTARDAYERAYDLVFAEDGMAAMTKEDHEHSVTRIFSRIGRIRKTDEIISALEI